MRFWYRHALTKSDLANVGKDVWMFISGSTSISTGAQLINANQQTNFISPKYSIPGISTNTAEANPAGYVIKAIYSNDNLGSTADIDSSYYNFDYKTGIFQFTSSAIATTVIADATNGRVYLTAYQYVGQVLSTRLTNVDASLATLSASIQAVSASGAVAGATNGTTFSGFDLGMLNNGTYMFTDGSVSASVTTTMQLINEVQFNRDVALLDASALDFNINTDIQPITDIYMTGRADVSEQKVYFKATFDINRAVNLGGIAIANLRYTQDGVADTIVALSLSYNSTTEEWEFEPTTAFTTAEAQVVQLYDASVPTDVALIGTRYYKGATASFVATA